jgi:hypothetical protein
MCINFGEQWGERFWSNISDREAEEIAAKHCGCPVYLTERRERPRERDTVFCFNKGQRPLPPPPTPPVSSKTTVLDQIPLEERKNLHIRAPDTPGFSERRIADDARRDSVHGISGRKCRINIFFSVLQRATLPKHES